MYPEVPTTKAGIDELKHQIEIHQREVRYLVSDDGRAAAIVASFDERRLDYRKLFYEIQAVIHKYQDQNTTIYAAGEPMIRGYGYYYLPVLVAIFFLSDLLMIGVLYTSFRGRSTWWAPVVTGTLATIWGFGFIGLQGYEFDPVMIVIRFILTARDMSHGIQWQGRYYDELEARGYNKIEACKATTTLMLPPGLLSILADIAGIVFISFGGIPALQHVASSGAVWLGGSLTMVFIFQPIMMSYLPTPKHVPDRPAGWPRLRILLDKVVAFPVTPGPVRSGAIGVVGALIIIGFVAGLRANIGYSQPGTPLYRQNSKVNRDINAVRQLFPIDEGWIIVRGKRESAITYNEAGTVFTPEVLRTQRDLARYLELDTDVDRIISVVPDIIEPYNRMFHYGHPKYRAVPASLDDAYALFTLFASNSAPGEDRAWLSMRDNDTCMRVLLKDHTYSTLMRLQRKLATFSSERGRVDPALNEVEIKFLGGVAGLYAAANDVLYEIDWLNITFVLGVVFIFCALVYRSFTAGVLFVVSCIAANFAAFIYMRATDIGITIDTIPVISLGIGLGVDYGIYVVSRILDECSGGVALEQAITTAVKQTGSAVLATFAVIVLGLTPWMFSPVLFQSEMSILLIILMFTNVIVGLLILPAYIGLARPGFIFAGRTGRELQRDVVARSAAEGVTHRY